MIFNFSDHSIPSNLKFRINVRLFRIVFLWLAVNLARVTSKYMCFQLGHYRTRSNVISLQGQTSGLRRQTSFQIISNASNQWIYFIVCTNSHRKMLDCLPGVKFNNINYWIIKWYYEEIGSFSLWTIWTTSYWMSESWIISSSRGRN